MENPSLSYQPSCDPTMISRELARFLVAGVLNDSDLERRIMRLEERFRIYASIYPQGLWAPGLVVDRDMKTSTETFLPAAEINLAFARLFSVSIAVSGSTVPFMFREGTLWLETLELMCQAAPWATDVNPARLLRRLTGDQELRTRFIFAVFLPKHHGGGFDRYPAQSRFLRFWLRQNRKRQGSRGIHCLDAACGAGEGTYDLVRILSEEGFGDNHSTINGTTLEPVELFAAAHGWFPHDPQRQENFRQQTRNLYLPGGIAVSFMQEDLIRPDKEKGMYDVILCNGLLGGPLLHWEADLKRAVANLSGRLKPGGLFLAADRFHEGWRKALPSSALRELLVQAGLVPLEVEEGVAGVSSG